jgi:exoribonuclease-2
MLPLKLCTDLSSFNEGIRRLALVVEILVADDGRIVESSIYPAVVQNMAQLTYNAVAAWLEGGGRSNGSSGGLSEVDLRILKRIHQSEELQAQLSLQDQAARLLRETRHDAGALTLDTAELKPFMGDCHIHLWKAS